MKKIEKNWLEWVVFGLSAGLIATVVGFLLYENATLGAAPPDIRLRGGEVEARAEYFALPIEVINQGDQTAEGVHVEVVLRKGDGEERSDFDLAFLPRRGRREAWVTFKTDPREGTLEMRVLGYEKP